MSRKFDQLRPFTLSAFPTAAAGSVLAQAGETRVLCTASVSTDLPSWLAKAERPSGWITAEYNMIPGSTRDRKRRGTDSRSTEIQRLIGRVLRAAVDLEKMAGISIYCDCEVLSADGGTRTTAISGAYVALAQAVRYAREMGLLTSPDHAGALRGAVGAVSVGIVDGQAYLDLDYQLDSRAEVDLNVAMNHAGELIEVQGTGEKGTFSRAQLNSLLDLAETGIWQIFDVQSKFLSGS